MTDIDVMKIKPKQWISGITICLGTLTPGSLIIFLFKHNLFLTLELGKLILLSVSITMPVVFFNYFIAIPELLFRGKFNDENHDGDIFSPVELFVTACGFAAISLYSSLGLAFFFNLNFKGYCLAVAIIELLFLFWKWGALFKGRKIIQ